MWISDKYKQNHSLIYLLVDNTFQVVLQLIALLKEVQLRVMWIEINLIFNEGAVVNWITVKAILTNVYLHVHIHV